MMSRVVLLLTVASILLASASAQKCSGRAVYVVEITGEWTPATGAPRNFPGSAHFTNFIYASHRASYSMFSVGDMATRGLQNVAEFGSTGTLRRELEDAGRKVFRIRTGGEPDIQGRTRFRIVVDGDRRSTRISGSAMIAPSPDWFIGINSAQVCVGGEFVDEISGVLVGYDAGTAVDGFQFTDMALGAVQENPQQPISRLGDDFMRFGTYRIFKRRAL